MVVLSGMLLMLSDPYCSAGGYLLMAAGAQVPVTKLKRDLLLEQIGGIHRS